MTYKEAKKSFIHRNWFAILVLASSLFISARASAQAAKSDSAFPPDQTNRNSVSGPRRAVDYIIGCDDVLNVNVLDVPELSHEYRVSATGTVTLPVLEKPIVAAGLTLSQFSEQLSQELKAQGLVSDPHVTASVEQSKLHTVTITGAVRQPQIYPVLTQTSLLDVLSQAGGATEDAGNTVIITRGDIGNQAQAPGNTNAGSGGTPSSDKLTIDLKRLLQGGDPGLNPVIYPGDHVTVPRAGIVYVVGAVNKPGGFTMNASSRGLTVLQALALAQDTKGTAKRNLTVILRSDPQAQDGRKRIPVDLKAILQGKNPDPVLQAEDILFVPDSSGKRALNQGIQSVVQVATGVAIYRF